MLIIIFAMELTIKPSLVHMKINHMGMHVSPFMSRGKSDSNNRRIVIDLSWPGQGSINYYTKANVYLGTVYRICYPTIDDITICLLCWVMEYNYTKMMYHMHFACYALTHQILIF